MSLRTQLFQMDMVVMSIMILCIVSAVLYQGIALLEKKIKFFLKGVFTLWIGIYP